MPENTRIEDIMFIGIETVPQAPSFDKLDLLATILGIPSPKDETDGSMADRISRQAASCMNGSYSRGPGTGHQRLRRDLSKPQAARGYSGEGKKGCQG